MPNCLALLPVRAAACDQYAHDSIAKGDRIYYEIALIFIPQCAILFWMTSREGINPSFHGEVDRERAAGRTEGVTADPIRDYLRAIGRTPLLNAEEEVMLTRRIEAGVFAGAILDVVAHRQEAQTLQSQGMTKAAQEGSSPSNVDLLFAAAKKYEGPENAGARAELEIVHREGQEAKDRMIRSNLRLVASIARGYQNRGLDYLELVQEGTFGLVRAVEKFDYTTGYKFSTYATRWIRQTINRGLADQAHTIRKPVEIVEYYNTMLRATEDFARKHGRPLTNAELAKMMRLSIERVEEIQDWMRYTLSLDYEVDYGGEPRALVDCLPDTVPGPERVFFEAESWRINARYIEELLACLDERKAFIIRARYGLDGSKPKTLDEIALQLGITREGVRQLEIRAFEKIRAQPRGVLQAARAALTEG